MRLGFPILISQLGMIVVGFADNAMVGHYSTDALAAASFVNNLFNIPMLMCLGFSFGMTPLIGALFSRGKHDDIGATMRLGLIINVLYAVLITAVMTVIYFNLHLLGQPDHLMPLIRPYYLIVLAGVLSMPLFQVFAQSSYAINSTKMPMWIMLASNAVNIAGNWLFIYGQFGLPELGLVGAGLSTLFARWICPLIIIWIFLHAKRYRPYINGLQRRKGNPEPLRKIFTTSLPVSFQMGFETASFSIAAVMAGWLGHIELAAIQIMIIIGMLGFTIYYGIAAAVSVLVANAAGEGDRLAMRRTAFAGYRIILGLALAASVTFILLGRHMILIFTTDEAVIATSLTLIFPLVLYQLGDATQITFANALRGTANVMPMVWIAFVAYVIVGIPATYLMGFTLGWGIVGIVASFSVSLFTAGALFLHFFLRTTRL